MSLSANWEKLRFKCSDPWPMSTVSGSQATLTTALPCSEQAQLLRRTKPFRERFQFERPIRFPTTSLPPHFVLPSSEWSAPKCSKLASPFRKRLVLPRPNPKLASAVLFCCQNRASTKSTPCFAVSLLFSRLVAEEQCSCPSRSDLSLTPLGIPFPPKTISSMACSLLKL